ncbi:DUF427 domain-containing protein [Nocardioides sp. AN3]
MHAWGEGRIGASRRLSRSVIGCNTHEMAIDLYAQQFRDLAELRFAATSKRVRAQLDGEVVLDTVDAMLVWEPRRVVPSYAVPPEDLRLDLIEHLPGAVPDDIGPVLPPHHHEWHTVPGRSLHLGTRGEVAFRPDEPALEGRVILHWDPFEWVEEDQSVVVHAHDPFTRIDVLRSNRHVRVDLGGRTIAESVQPTALYETGLPTRWYLPRQDVRMDLLTPSEFHTACAYKGTASYLSAEGGADIAWYYADPLPEAEAIRDLISFWRAAEVYVDGNRVRTGMPGEG